MKYIFVLSLLFKKYKRSLKIRLFSNDIFIDELELSNDIDLKDTDRSKTSIKYRKFNELKFYYQSKEPPEKKILQYPEKIFVYEIDESVLKDELRIEINDKNSDYTNGFMTKSNLIRIEELFLFPADLFFSNKIKKIFKMCNNNLEALDKNTSNRD